MKTVCIVQARMGSKRLPGKVLLPLNGHTVIGEVLTRCKRIPGVDEVVCAMSLTTDCLLLTRGSKYCRAALSSVPRMMFCAAIGPPLRERAALT
jgi:CMP-N-acetylneuraminic acid synthetase